MIPTDKIERRRIIKRMINGICNDPNASLTKWEQNFIDSISTQFNDTSNLTDRQCEILEKIYDKL